MSKKIFRLTVKAEDEHGQEIQSPVPGSWAAFLNGNWTRELPTRPGKYIIAHKNGRVLGTAFVHYQGSELQISMKDSALHPLKPLEGKYWWWTMRMPPVMPRRVPPWDDDDETEKPRLRLVANDEA